MTRPIIDNFLGQALACEELGSPFTAQLCRTLATSLDDTTAFGKRLLAWPQSAERDAAALRACGALHALARSGRVPALTAAYPPTNSGDLATAIHAAIAAEDTFLTTYLDSPPQTNEVARSAILLGGLRTIANETSLPLDLIEIGSSAGLNLLADQYRYDLGNGLHWGASDAPLTIECAWSGRIPPLTAPLTIASRAGCDRNPLDPASPQTVERLLSYVWADQTARMKRLSAALSNAARSTSRVIHMDAAAFVEQQLASPQSEGTVRVLMHTVVWQYLTKEVQARIEAAIQQAATRATADRPFAHLAFESDRSKPGGGVTLTLWPNGEMRDLARADFHGRWVEWV